MKRIIILTMAAILILNCNAQENEKSNLEPKGSKELVKHDDKPKGTWKVDKEFDENGNMIRYDSIYSWSSKDIDELKLENPDSLLQSFQSRFYRNFSKMDTIGFKEMFSPDSSFTKRFFGNDFFTSDFGEDFLDIERLHKRMEHMQHDFLEKYHSEFKKLENDGVENK